MALKKRNPAAAATATGAGAQGNEIPSNIANLAQTIAAANSPVIVSIKRRPYGKAAWLVSIKGVCTDTHFRDQKLRNYRKFCNAIKHRFGVMFDPMSQADWLAIVEAAIAAEGDAS